MSFVVNEENQTLTEKGYPRKYLEFYQILILD